MDRRYGWTVDVAQAQERAGINEQALQNRQLSGERLMAAAGAQAATGAIRAMWQAETDANYQHMRQRYDAMTAQARAQYQVPKRVVEKRVEVLPSVDKLARAIWEAMPEVRDFVASVADCHVGRTDADWEYDFERKARAFSRAWERDEPGDSRTLAFIMASRVLRAFEAPPSGSKP